MVKVDVISGFLGAGKTTLIKKIFSAKMGKERIALIENEFGQIGIDGSFLKDSGIEIKEINSGCICCSLVGNFEKSLKELIDTYTPDRIIIEPSGVGKLSDIVGAINNTGLDIKVNILCTVVDGGKCKMYLKNFGEFYVDQIKEANTIVVSKTDKLSEEKVLDAYNTIREFNVTAKVITTPITELDGAKLIENLEENVSLVEELVKELKEKHKHEHHHHHHEDGEECDDSECECHHHHDDDDEEEHECHHHHHHHEDGEECDDSECECHHHHDDDDEEEHECHHHHHHHEDGEECDDPECECHHHHDDDDEEEHECHHHHHHHEDGEECDDPECECHHHHEGHHHADDVFASWGMETPLSYSHDELDNVLKILCGNDYGMILRSKGILKASDNEKWYYFDFVAGDYEIRLGDPDVMGKICVIGTNLKKEQIAKLFKGNK